MYLLPDSVNSSGAAKPHHFAGETDARNPTQQNTEDRLVLVGCSFVTLFGVAILLAVIAAG